MPAASSPREPRLPGEVPCGQPARQHWHRQSRSASCRPPALSAPTRPGNPLNCRKMPTLIQVDGPTRPATVVGTRVDLTVFYSEIRILDSISISCQHAGGSPSLRCRVSLGMSDRVSGDWAIGLAAGVHIQFCTHAYVVPVCTFYCAPPVTWYVLQRLLHVS
jgi:hypothetical protein